MMNIQGLMKQAQMMQKKMQDEITLKIVSFIVVMQKMQ